MVVFCVLFFLLLNNDALNSEKGCFVVQVVRVYQRYNEKRSWLWVFRSDVTLRELGRWVLGFRLLYLLGVCLILDLLGSCFLRAICCLLSWLARSRSSGLASIWGIVSKDTINFYVYLRLKFTFLTSSAQL